MENYILVGVIALIVGAALWYIIRAKKKGKKCIGCPESSCPSSGKCGGNCSCCSGCGKE
ncbi:MAG: FeoB-associated Cys-rich membrane protein [Ruminococcaceae bacterium]|nr:FeoB-associated Cys-rich membrane protein [Oscillospiraceae bacterium]